MTIIKPKTKSLVVPNQVFIGCPWKNFRSKYERIVGELKKRFALSYVLVGRSDDQSAEDLLSVIKDKLLSSSYAIFDATGGNANVSLEFGLAEAQDIPRNLYVSSHKAFRKDATDQPIISDLAGKRRMPYAQEKALANLLTTFSKHHSYTTRVERFLTKHSKRKTKGQKKRTRSLCLKIIHALDEKMTVRREDVILQLQADISRYSESEVDQMIKVLHKAGLIVSSVGRYSTISMV